VPRAGWQWELVVVGSMLCVCNQDCVFEGTLTTCYDDGLNEPCNTHNTCDVDEEGGCQSFPPPDPDRCAGPVPPPDREGWARHDGRREPYAPDDRYSYNSSGATNQISMAWDGNFTVTFPGLGGEDGNVQVVALGPGTERCKAGGWQGRPDLQVNVHCYNQAGHFVNTPFLVYFFATDDTATSTREVGHARYDVPVGLDSPPPDPAFQWNSSGALPTTTRLEAGSYVVRFTDLAHANGAAIVTALGVDRNFCQVLDSGRYTEGGVAGTQVHVWCFDGSRLADTSFALRYEWQQPVPGASVREGYALADTPSAPAYTPDAQFNSAGAWNTAARSSTGRYSLTYPELPAPVSGPAVSARASTVLMSARAIGASHCKVVGWGGAGADTTVEGRCFSHTGVSGDRAYDQVYLTRKRTIVTDP
jgi:hypothetical protein